MVNLPELVPQKVKLVGFHVVCRCGFDDHTRGTQRVGGGELDQGEHRGDKMWPPVQIQPKNIQMAHFLLYQVWGKTRIPKSIQIPDIFWRVVFSAVPFPSTKYPFRVQVSFRVPGVHGTQKKTSVQIQPKHAGENIHQMQLDIRKTRAEWRRGEGFPFNVFPTSLCGVLVFDSVPARLRPASVLPPPPPPLWHTPSFTHNFVTHHLSHATLPHTIFHTQLCHTPSFTYNFVTHHLSHNFHTHRLSHTVASWHLCHWAGSGGALGRR